MTTSHPRTTVVALNCVGDLATTGVRVAVEIGPEGDRPTHEYVGSLPADPELLQSLGQWQQAYRALGGTTRIKPKEIAYQGSFERVDRCRESARVLGDALQAWLASSSFQSLDLRLRETLGREDPIRVLLRTSEPAIERLPWHLWSFFERYPQAELAVGTPSYERPPEIRASGSGAVKILAILGDGTGIDTTADRQLLAELPDAEVTLLVEPRRQAMSDRLWEQPWDILFFAGHSQTLASGGQFGLNRDESLSLEEVRYGLRRALAGGLQLAIFNSCDGLGLAKELEQLHMPQSIVMREPVPDRVAQEYLKYFLTAYTRGQSLYLAQREARERLQGLEDTYPCASWLPVLYQNPAAMPPDWQTLRDRRAAPAVQPPTPIAPQPVTPKGARITRQIAVAVAITLGVMALRLTGILAAPELLAYDWLLRQRPATTPATDPNLVVVEVTADDTDRYGYPLRDRTVAAALEKILAHNPAAIGLDLHRHQARNPGRDRLMAVAARYPEVFFVCSIGARTLYGPPPEFSVAEGRDRVGFSDLEVDGKGGGNRPVRRQLLSYDPTLTGQPTSCKSPYSLAFHLAYRFLAAQQVEPLAPNRAGQWQLGKTTFQPLPTRAGAYQHLDGQSSQVLLNYWTTPQHARRLSLNEVLETPLSAELLRDRIVLIGTTDPVGDDYFATPYGQLPGVWIHAHAVSQLVHGATEGRSPIAVWPVWGDGLWVLGWTCVGTAIAGQARSRRWAIVAVAILPIALHQACLRLLIVGVWVPFVPVLIALGVGVIASAAMLAPINGKPP